MKAIIMAGGDGSRLRPVTCTMPKPMVPVLNVPVMEYAVRLLRMHGVKQIAVTLRYLPDAIREYFGDGSRFGVRITYFTETTALGTAGGVGQAREFLDETCIVLSGDGITDCDLTAAVGFHRASCAEATLVTVHTDDPREFGLVCTDSAGRITQFREKPEWSDVVCDRVNTGIYILEPSVLDRIPPDRACDFSKDVFPAMLRSGQRLYAWDADCYWCDIGDTAALIQANRDALDGKISLIPAPEGGILRGAGSCIDHRAQLLPPVCIGEGATIAAGAVVGPGCVIGAGAAIAGNASVRRSVLAPGTRIGANAQLRGCLTGENTRIGADAQLYENAVTGAGCTVGCGATLCAGVRIWPEKTVPDRTRLRENLMWGSAAQAAFHAGAVDCFTPAHATLCAQALCAAVKPRVVLIAHCSDPAAAAQHCAACAGLMAQGAQVYDCRCATLMELRSAIRHIGADCACYLTADRFHPIHPRGVAIDGVQRRQFIGHLSRGDCPAPYSGATRLPQSAGRCDLIYLREAVSDDRIRRLAGFPHPIAVYAQREQLLTLAERAFLRAGLTVRAEWEEEMMELAPDEIGIWLSDTGESARFFTGEGELTEAESQLLTIQALLEADEKRLILPDDCTPVAESMAERYRAQVERIAGGPARWLEQLSRIAPEQLPVHTDGIVSALECLAMLNHLHMSLADFRRSVPCSVRKRRTIPMPAGSRAHALERLNTALRPDKPGHFHITHGDDHAWILPSDESDCCTILAESADIEIARELCDRYERILRDALRPSRQ